jgi:two-component system NarL family response regulator
MKAHTRRTSQRMSKTIRIVPRIPPPIYIFDSHAQTSIRHPFCWCRPCANTLKGVIETCNLSVGKVCEALNFHMFVTVQTAAIGLATLTVGIFPLRRQARGTVKILNVLLVDDHIIFREALVRLLGTSIDLRVVGHVGNFVDTVRIVASQKIDIVVLDLVLPGRHGIEMVRSLKVLQSTMKILVLSAHGEAMNVAGVLNAGADGFLTKGCIFDELVRAIHRVMGGERYIYPEIAHDMAMMGMYAPASSSPVRPAMYRT